MMMENKKRKLNNKGASLIELIITIAIMIIVIGGLTIGFSVITNTYAKRAANNLNDFLQTTRTKAMSVSADQWNMEISKNSDGDYVIVINKVTFTKGKDEDDVVEIPEVFDRIIVGGDVKITYTNNGASVPIEIDDSHIMKIVFSLSQGSISDIRINKDSLLTGSTTEDMGVFDITSGSFSRQIEVYYTTGKSQIID